MPFCCLFICPLSVAGHDSGRYFSTASAVRPGHVSKWLFLLPWEGLTLWDRISIDGGILWLLPWMTSDIHCLRYGFLHFLLGRWESLYLVSTVRPIILSMFFLGPSTPLFRCDILSHFFHMSQNILHLLNFLLRPGMCVQVLVLCVPSVLPWASLGCLSHMNVFPG